MFLLLSFSLEKKMGDCAFQGWASQIENLNRAPWSSCSYAQPVGNRYAIKQNLSSTKWLLNTTDSNCWIQCALSLLGLGSLDTVPGFRSLGIPFSSRELTWSNCLEPETSIASPNPLQQLLHILQNPIKDFTFSVAQDSENQQTKRQT